MHKHLLSDAVLSRGEIQRRKWRHSRRIKNVKHLLFLWFYPFPLLVVWPADLQRSLPTPVLWFCSSVWMGKSNIPNLTYIKSQSFKGNRSSLDTLHNEFWKQRFWLNLKLAHTFADVLLMQGSLQKEKQKASIATFTQNMNKNVILGVQKKWSPPYWDWTTVCTRFLWLYVLLCTGEKIFMIWTLQTTTSSTEHSWKLSRHAAFMKMLCLIKLPESQDWRKTPFT